MNDPDHRDPSDQPDHRDHRRDRTDVPLEVHIGHHELELSKRYESASIANDVLIGLWFLVGSFMFLVPVTVFWGTWLFVIGSAQMLIRPLIRLSRQLHLQRLRTVAGPVPVEADDDF